MQRFIDSSSSVPVINGARIIKANNFPLGQVIDATNPLVLNSKTAVRNHFSGVARLTFSQANTYLASSVLLHTLDSWAYLSHAIESLLKGDGGIATHLAYYSELRASMSFLASEGIGIFNSEHFCLTSANSIVPNPIIYRKDGSKVNTGTHQFVWNAIEKWSSSTVKPSNQDILKVFKVNGKGFDEWAAQFPFPTTVSSILIVQKWLKKWNVDVQFFRNDRELRNQVSYTPQRLKAPSTAYSLNQIIEKLTEFWNLMEPSHLNRFQVLDKYLLRIFIQELYGSLPGPIKTANSLESTISSTLSNLGLNHDQSFVDFLKDATPISHSLFAEARSNSASSLSVIARATLMLRVSTGYTVQIFNKASIDKTDLDFLWERYGTENGFWKPGNAPLDFEQLWDDVKDYIDEVTQWARHKSPHLCLADIYKDGDMPIAFNYFKQYHRAGLWGLTG